MNIFIFIDLTNKELPSVFFLFWNDDNKHLFNSISSAEKGETGREKKKTESWT